MSSPYDEAIRIPPRKDGWIPGSRGDWVGVVRRSARFGWEWSIESRAKPPNAAAISGLPGWLPFEGWARRRARRMAASWNRGEVQRVREWEDA